MEEVTPGAAYTQTRWCTSIEGFAYQNGINMELGYSTLQTLHEERARLQTPHEERESRQTNLEQRARLQTPRGKGHVNSMLILIN